MKNWPILQTGDVHLWVADLSSVSPDHNFWGDLTVDEQERALRLNNVTKKNTFIFARGLLRYLLSNYLNIPAKQLTFTYNEYGKPQLSSGAIQFNISHSHDIILFAITSRFNIGVDIEFINRDLDYHALAERFFTNREYQKLISLPEHIQKENFFRYWTRKEAISKALGTSIFDCLHKLDISEIDEGQNKINDFFLYEIPLTIPFYIASLAVQFPAAKISLYDWFG